MFREPVVYVDIETTGGSYHSSRIIEIAIIRVENNEITQTYHSLINPGTPIPYHISRLTGITDGDVADKPFFADIADEIHDALNGAVFIAHHVRFDYSFIKRQLELCNIHYNPRMLCSVRMSRALYPEVKGHSLAAIIKRFDIETAARHRALDDAGVIKSFFELAFLQRGAEAFDAAASRQLKHKSMPPNLASGALDSIPNTPGVYTFMDSNNTPIYIGKSVTLRKRIMSHFAQDTAIDKEMKLSLNTHNISVIQTGTELEALLLESQMVKEQLPVYNRQLRRQKKMYVLRTKQDEKGYRSIVLNYIDSQELAPDKTIYGVYPSKMKARKNLESLQKLYDLCPKLLGLEKANKACFKYQLKKCNGACAGIESAQDHNARLETAFERNRLEEWPYKNPIVLSHLQSTDSHKHLVIDNWNVIGEIQSDEGCETQFKPWQAPFDIDTYKIIRSYLASKAHAIKLQPISYRELEALGA